MEVMSMRLYDDISDTVSWGCQRNEPFTKHSKVWAKRDCHEVTKPPAVSY